MRNLTAALLGLMLVACGDDDGGGGGGMAPVIQMVAWTHEAGCVAGSSGDVTVVTTVNDPDTATNMLTFTGSASGCTGSINAASATITCPNAAPYPGMVRVEDPEGNSDSQAITIDVCENGSAP